MTVTLGFVSHLTGSQLNIISLAGQFRSGGSVLGQVLFKTRNPFGWQAGLWSLLAIGMAGLFLLATIRSGQPWDGDAELYIREALNIIGGERYGFSHYVINPIEPHHPSAMPPGLPLVLVPVLAMFGINYWAIKAELVFCFLGLMGIVAHLGRQHLSPSQTFVILLALGFNPFVWMFKDVVYSEFPFMLFAYGALAAIDELDRRIRYRRMAPLPWRLITIIGVLLAASLLIRTAAIALFAAFAGQCLFRNRRFFISAASALVIALIFNSVISRAFPADIGTYTSPLDVWRNGALNENLALIRFNCAAYAGALIDLIKGAVDYPPPLNWLVGGFASAAISLSLFRIIWMGWQKLEIFDLFVGASLAMLILFPIAQEPARYALPILPVLLFRLVGAFHGRALVVLTISLGLVYIAGYIHRPADDGLSVDRPEAHALYQVIRDNVPANDLIIASHPTVIGLYAQRRSTNPIMDMTEERFWQWAEQIDAKWLVTNSAPLIDHLRPIEPALMPKMTSVYSNEQFTLYRLDRARL